MVLPISTTCAFFLSRLKQLLTTGGAPVASTSRAIPIPSKYQKVQIYRFDERSYFLPGPYFYISFNRSKDL